MEAIMDQLLNFYGLPIGVTANDKFMQLVTFHEGNALDKHDFVDAFLKRSIGTEDYVMAEMIVSNYKEAELSEWTVVRSLAIAFKNAVSLLNLHPTEPSMFMPAYESAFGFLVTIRYFCQDKDRTDEFLANVTSVLLRYSSEQALKYFKETCHHAVAKIQYYEDRYYQITPKEQLSEHPRFPCLGNNYVQ